MGQRVGLQAYQGNVGVHREPDRCTLRLRVARRLGSLVSLLRHENWEFSDDGLMSSRFASINDIPILGSERKYHWVLGRRPDDHPGLSDLDL